MKFAIFASIVLCSSAVVRAQSDDPAALTFENFVSGLELLKMGPYYKLNSTQLAAWDHPDVVASILERIGKRPAAGGPIVGSPLFFGQVGVGETITQNIVLVGARPFRVLRATCDDCFDVKTPDEEASTIHLLPVTFVGKEAGDFFVTVVRIRTDWAAENTVEATAYAETVLSKPKRSSFGIAIPGDFWPR